MNKNVLEVFLRTYIPFGIGAGTGLCAPVVSPLVFVLLLLVGLVVSMQMTSKVYLAYIHTTKNDHMIKYVWIPGTVFFAIGVVGGYAYDVLLWYAFFMCLSCLYFAKYSAKYMN